MAALPEILARHARSQPDALALITPEEVITYRQLWERVSGLADRLRHSGLSRFGLCGDNGLAWVLADLACGMANVVCVPIPGFFSPRQTEHLIDHAGLDALLRPRSDLPEARYQLESAVALQRLPTTPGAVAVPPGTGKVTFTSGSTGKPKGVCLAHDQLDATVSALAERLQGVPIRRHLCLLPLATLLENVAGIYLPLTLGASILLWPQAELGMTGSSGLDASRLITVLNHTRPDSLILVPELAAALVQAAEEGWLKTGHFRFLAVGGARVSPALLSRAQALGLPLYEGYGLSECGSVVALNRPGAGRAGTVGRPLSHVTVTVDDQGEISVSGNTFLGYLGDPTQPAARLATGDLGSLDDDGYLRVSGRRKNLLITSFGRNISPEWLESELMQRVGARQAMAFGDGEAQPSALLVLTDSRPLEQVQAALRQVNTSLPDYARLRRVYLRREPLTRADGHVTANGRPVRHRILENLPALQAASQPLTLSTTAPESCTPAPVKEQTLSE
ncbi:MAG: AMP-binding protein [Marinobacter sp.]|uniref:AMP-binding protein n=1 Tax=Marinobacter sp. TaxID=50741 RepID=UPI00299E0FF9|nr:AMP-binding protein [Marinobacter sp.]MDX1755323.1 AMP-binding protein [Marinobacter sp.]